MIKAIVWDMGGVLIREERPITRCAWESRLGLPEGEMDRIVFYHPLAPKLFIGDVNPDQFWALIGADLDLTDKEAHQLGVDFWGEPVWNEEVLDYIAELKIVYRQGVMSDAWITTRQTVKERINSDLFDEIMFSAEEGIRKPNPEPFLRMSSRLGIELQEMVFVDDRKVNVEAAAELGIHGILYTPELDLPKEVERIFEFTSV